MIEMIILEITSKHCHNIKDRSRAETSRGACSIGISACASRYGVEFVSRADL